MPETVSKLTFNGGMQFTATQKDGLSIILDTSYDGKPAEGPAPMEVLLHALGGCSGMDVVFMLRKMKREPQKLDINLQGIQADKHPKIYRQINITYSAQAEGLRLAELEKAVKMSLEKYCSVALGLDKDIKINWKCEVIEG